MYSEMLDIATHPMPVDLPEIGIHLYWHVNVDKEPANKWLRNKMILAASNAVKTTKD
jgi:hypothetical protein